MKLVRATILLGAAVAMLVSVAPLMAIFHQDHNPPGGGGGSNWNVTCQYDGNEILISKTCTSGGSSSCNCP